jgi:hypothetical protein
MLKHTTKSLFSYYNYHHISMTSNLVKFPALSIAIDGGLSPDAVSMK